MAKKSLVSAVFSMPQAMALHALARAGWLAKEQAGKLTPADKRAMAVLETAIEWEHPGGIPCRCTGDREDGVDLD